MSRDWITTFDALKSVYVDGAFSNIAINEAIEHHSGCSTGFVRMFTKGVIRDTILLDYLIDHLADKGVRKIKNRTLIILRMGIYAIRSLDSVPDHAACNSAVRTAKAVSKGSDRFVNGVLRNYIRRREELESDLENLEGNSGLALRYSFPEELVELIHSQYSSDTENILAALSRPAPLVIRTNTLKIQRDELVERLNAEGIKAVPLEESELAVLCEGGNLIGSDMFRDGLFSVQSLSSIMAIEAMGLSAGARVLDMCSAPGGKTAAMAEIMGNSGEITACDIHEHRLKLIEASCKRTGVSIVNTVLMDGTQNRKEFEGAFDYVLADVPCSGLGVIAGKPELKLRVNVDEFKELEEVQLAILRNALSYVKPGGTVEYSTCTINTDENDGIVAKALDGGSFAQIIEKKTILPYNNSIGFYYCIMRKC